MSHAQVPMPAPVRLATAADALELARLRWMSRSAKEQSGEELDGFSRRFRDWLGPALEPGPWRCVVAESGDGALIGCMYLRAIRTVPVPGIDDRAWGYVSHAFVVPQARNRGIGTALLSTLIAQARRQGLMDLQVWPSIGAIALYRRAGFVAPEQQRAAGVGEPSYLLPLA